MKRMIEKALDEQVEKINSLLGEDRIEYTLADVFNILPDKIRWNGREGYLKISKFDIVYSCLELEMQGKIAALFSFVLGTENVFDAFIEALVFFKEHEDVEFLND